MEAYNYLIIVGDYIKPSFIGHSVNKHDAIGMANAHNNLSYEREPITIFEVKHWVNNGEIVYSEVLELK